jgi:O-antigen biosynthesis protein
MEQQLSVILLTYNSFELLSKSLLEIINHIPQEGTEVIVVDNGSTDEQAKTGFEWWKKTTLSKPVRCVSAPHNLGFSGGMNFGVAHARGKNILLLSNDVLVKDGNMFTEIVDLLDGNDKLLIGGRIVDWDSGWNTFIKGNKSYLVPYCEGYALAMSKVAWDDLGGLDEEYNPHDYEDMDLSMNALAHGYILTQLDSKYMIHLSGQTIGKEANRVQTTNKNRIYFEKKWSEEFSKCLN